MLDMLNRQVRRWILVGSFAFLGTLVGYFVRLKTGTFKSVAILSMPMPVDQFRRLYDMIGNEATFMEFAQVNHINPALRKHILDGLEDARLGKYKDIEPIFSISRDDLKLIGNLPTNLTATLTGLRLSIDRPTSTEATAGVEQLSRYVRTIAYRDKLLSQFLIDLDEFRQRQQRTRARIIELKFQTEQTEKRIADFKEMVRQYPDSIKIDMRQLVSINEGSERFLSPVSQIVAAQSRIIDNHRTQAELNRQVRQAQVELAFYEQAIKILQPLNGIEHIHQMLIAAAHQTLDEKAKSDDVAQAALANILTTLNSMLDQYSVQNRFIAGPSLAQEITSPSPLKVGIMIGVMMALITAAWIWRATLQQTARRFLAEE